MIKQQKIILKERSRGFHLITDEILLSLNSLPDVGLVQLFLQHTSAGLTINENYDPDVHYDLTNIMDHLIPEGENFYTHILEGRDDMPAHMKSSLVGTSLSVPIANGRLALGTWQGIYLCEFRNHGGPRTIVVTIVS